ncbi:MAG TPA: hypothetical protein VFH92_11425, partial [Phenylobacterium sp.]|nr:hypothetical protein [Phenylobacterium sp.]
MPARLSGLANRVTTQADAQGHSRAAEPWRSWYNTPEWQALRRRVFKRDHYRCQWEGCGLVLTRPIADHIEPHRGDRALFFDDG